jgi:MFS transporter, DHA2 family, multidrug resistance protein
LQALATHNAASVRNHLSDAIRPDNPVLAAAAPDFSFDSMASLARMAGQIGKQAAMVGYLDDYWLTFLLALVMMPIVLLMNPQKRQAPAEGQTPLPPMLAE